MQSQKTYLYTYTQCIHIPTNIKIINREERSKERA